MNLPTLQDSTAVSHATPPRFFHKEPQLIIKVASFVLPDLECGLTAVETLPFVQFCRWQKGFALLFYFLRADTHC